MIFRLFYISPGEAIGLTVVLIVFMVLLALDSAGQGPIHKKGKQ